MTAHKSQSRMLCVFVHAKANYRSVCLCSCNNKENSPLGVSIAFCGEVSKSVQAEAAKLPTVTSNQCYVSTFMPTFTIPCGVEIECYPVNGLCNLLISTTAARCFTFISVCQSWRSENWVPHERTSQGQQLTSWLIILLRPLLAGPRFLIWSLYLYVNPITDFDSRSYFLWSERSQ